MPVTETHKFAFDNRSLYLSFKSRGEMDHYGGCGVSQVQLHTTQLQTPHKEVPASTQIKRDQQSVMKQHKKHSASKLQLLKTCLGENKIYTLMISVLFPLGPCHLVIKNNNKINSLCSIESSLRREIAECEEMKADQLYQLWRRSQRSQINLDWWGSA